MKQLFKDKKYWKEMGYILLFGVFINIACFCMPMVGHCATTLDNNTYFPFNSGYNENNININQSFIDEQLANGAMFIYCEDAGISGYPNSVRYAVLTDIQQSSGSSSVRLYGEIMSGYGGSNFSLYWDNPNSLIYYKVNYYLDYGDGRDISLYNYYENTLSSFYNIPSAIDSSNVYYTKYNIPLNSINNDVIMIYAPTEEISVGEFTDLPPLDEILNNLTDTYTPDFSPVYPNIDTNKTDIENQKSFFDTLSQGITQNFNNLGSNLQKFFNKIQEKLTNVSNAISTNIHNGFATLMQNIRDFFGPKLDKIIELLTKLVNDDEEDVKEVWESTQIYQDFDSISQFTSSGFAVWDDTIEPNTYKIPFHVEQIPLLHCDTVQYIDLGLFSPVIPYIRSIMWALMVYSVFYTVVDSLANYINGGDE